MTDITQLTNNGEIEDQDLLVLFSQDNSATRSVSFNVLRNAVPTIESMAYDGLTLTTTMTDTTEFTVDIPTPTSLTYAAPILTLTLSDGSTLTADLT